MIIWVCRITGKEATIDWCCGCEQPEKDFDYDWVLDEVTMCSQVEGGL